MDVPVREQENRDLESSTFRPLEDYRMGRNEIVAGTVSPSCLLPIQRLQRVEKIMDEWVGGIRTPHDCVAASFATVDGPVANASCLPVKSTRTAPLTSALRARRDKWRDAA